MSSIGILEEACYQEEIIASKGALSSPRSVFISPSGAEMWYFRLFPFNALRFYPQWYKIPPWYFWVPRQMVSKFLKFQFFFIFTPKQILLRITYHFFLQNLDIQHFQIQNIVKRVDRHAYSSLQNKWSPSHYQSSLLKSHVFIVPGDSSCPT